MGKSRPNSSNGFYYSPLWPSTTDPKSIIEGQSPFSASDFVLGLNESQKLLALFKDLNLDCPLDKVDLTAITLR